MAHHSTAYKTYLALQRATEHAHHAYVLLTEGVDTTYYIRATRDDLLEAATRLADLERMELGEGVLSIVINTEAFEAVTAQEDAA